jgi:hypothetical protein
MAEKSAQLIVDALRRAAAEPAGLPLHGGKTSPGLFPISAPARQAAQECKDQAYLRVVRTESRGKTSHEICSLTEKGLTYLLGQDNPQQVLEELVRTLDARREQLAGLETSIQQSQAELQAFRNTAEKLCQALNHGSDLTTTFVAWKGDGYAAPQAALGAVLTFLERRQNSTEDCPLPELYRHVCCVSPLSIGQFHDLLRRLVEDGRIYLHPWTGPLFELPDPPCALLVGHEIAYYASLRK